MLLLPLGWGYTIIFLNHYRGEATDFGNIFDGYKDFTRILLTMLLQGIYVMLWMLLLIIPGIIKSFSYALIPYILRDYPELQYNSAIELSMKMMEGHKMRLFLLYLSFIGWAILAVLTCGIGFLWLYPYMMTSAAAFYEDVKADYEKANAKPAPAQYVTEEVSTYEK